MARKSAKRNVRAQTSSVSRRRSLTPKQKSKNVRPTKFSRVFQKLAKLGKEDQRYAMMCANNAFIRQFCNHVKKLRTAPVNAKLRLRLQKQKKSLRKLVNKKTNADMQRSMLIQRGGFLPLLMAALPALGSVVGSIIQAAT